MIGGNIRKGFHCTVGPAAKEQMKTLYADKVFIAANALSEKRGLSTPSIENADIKKQMIENARICIALVDSSKIGMEALCKFAELCDIDVLVSDDRIDEKFSKKLKEGGTELITAH